MGEVLAIFFFYSLGDQAERIRIYIKIIFNSNYCVNCWGILVIVYEIYERKIVKRKEKI